MPTQIQINLKEKSVLAYRVEDVVAGCGAEVAVEHLRPLVQHHPVETYDVAKLVLLQQHVEVTLLQQPMQLLALIIDTTAELLYNVNDRPTTGRANLRRPSV